MTNEDLHIKRLMAMASPFFRNVDDPVKPLPPMPIWLEEARYAVMDAAWNSMPDCYMANPWPGSALRFVALDSPGVGDPLGNSLEGHN